MSNVLAIIGLFLPVVTPVVNPVFKFKGKPYGFTMTVGEVPLGWIIIVVAFGVSTFTD